MGLELLYRDWAEDILETNIYTPWLTKLEILALEPGGLECCFKSPGDLFLEEGFANILDHCKLISIHPLS